MTEKFEDYAGKKVVLRSGGAEREGTVEAGSAIGIVFRPKGSSRTDLVEAKDIESIVLATKTKLKQRTLPEIAKGKYREHLIERHGYKVSDIEPLTEEAAEEYHASLDHSDLGHVHKEKSPVEEAIAAAEDDSAYE